MAGIYEVIKRISDAMFELGVPTEDYPASVSNAVTYLKHAFDKAEEVAQEFVALNDKYESLLLHSQEYDELAKNYAALYADLELCRKVSKLWEQETYQRIAERDMFRAEVERLKKIVDECVNPLNINAEIETQRKAALYYDLRAEVESLRKRLNPSFDYVDGQVVAIGEDEIDRLNTDLAAAVEALRKIATHPIYGIDPIEIVQIARAFLARMEVK
jgi:hypothetical protein